MSDPAPVFDLDRDDLRVLGLYGRAMLSAQLLEFSIFQLAQLQRGSPNDFEKAFRRLEGLLKQPRGDQAKKLAQLSEEMREDLLDALVLRNRLAHDFLLEYRMGKVVDGAPWATELLAAATQTFDGLIRELDAHADVQLQAAGIEDLSEEEAADVLESLRRWSEDLSAGLQQDEEG